MIFALNIYDKSLLRNLFQYIINNTFFFIFVRFLFVFSSIKNEVSCIEIGEHVI